MFSGGLGWVDVAGGLAVALGALLGGLTGFGYGLVATPLLLLLGLPAPLVIAVNMLLGMSTRAATAFELRASVDVVRVCWLMVGSLPGLAAGMAVVQFSDAQVLKRYIGVAIIVSAVCMVCLRGGNRIVTIPTVAAVGIVSGILGVTSSLNGIPPAILYSYEQRSPRQLLADLSAYFVVSNPLIFALLVVAGGSPLRDIMPRFAIWLPGVLLATFLANRLASSIPVRWFRLLVLGVVLAGGASTLLLG